MKLKENLLYVEEHFKCDVYNHEGRDSTVEMIELKKGEKHERSLKVPEMVFVYVGSVTVSFIGNYDVVFDRRRMMLFPPADRISIYAEEDASLLICRLHKEIPFCELINFEKLKQYAKNEKGNEVPLVMNSAILGYLDGFVPHVRNKLRCANYLKIKITEFFYLLRAYYTKEELATFFHPLLGGDFAFRNHLFNTAGSVSSVEQWAALCHMSSASFRRKFYKVMGRSPSAFLIEEKAAAVRRELERSCKPLKLIAESLGFSSTTVFHHFCRKHLDATANEIRRAAKAKGIIKRAGLPQN